MTTDNLRNTVSRRVGFVWPQARAPGLATADLALTPQPRAFLRRPRCRWPRSMR